MYEGNDGFYMARLDSLAPGGLPPFAAAEPTLRKLVAQEKALDVLMKPAGDLSKKASATSLEAAAKAAKLTVVSSPTFTPTSYVPDIGRMNEVIGAAFALPVGSVSDPIKTCVRCIRDSRGPTCGRGQRRLGQAEG